MGYLKHTRILGVAEEGGGRVAFHFFFYTSKVTLSLFDNQKNAPPPVSQNGEYKLLTFFVIAFKHTEKEEIAEAGGAG